MSIPFIDLAVVAVARSGQYIMEPQVGEIAATGPGGLIVRDTKAGRVISLPMSAYLDEAVQKQIVEAVASYG